MKGEIYKITNTSNGKVYIGQTIRGISKRGKEHCKTSVCPKLHNAIIKYGQENFTIETLGSGTGDAKTVKRCLDALEVAFIKHYDSINKGYNIASGGMGTVGYHHTDDAKKKMSNAKKGKSFINGGSFKKGDKARAKAVIQYSLDGTYINRYDSATDAAKAVGRSFSKIAAAARGDQAQCGGYCGEYETN